MAAKLPVPSHGMAALHRNQGLAVVDGTGAGIQRNSCALAGAVDRKFCENALDAAASAPRNIAEGFGRYGDREFASFVNIARGSQLETQTNLLVARNRGYLTDDEFKRLWALSEEMVKTTSGLLRELRRRTRPVAGKGRR